MRSDEEIQKRLMELKAYKLAWKIEMDRNDSSIVRFVGEDSVAGLAIQIEMLEWVLGHE